MEDNEQRGLSGGALKWIAALTMFIDHFAAVVLLGRLYSQMAWGSGLWSRQCYWDMRVIGRLAFPIYCFLIGEGYRHTHSLRNYLLRLLGFALLAELPFDLAFQRRWLDMSSQNVFFTLALGLAAIAIWDTLLRGREGRERLLAGVAAALACAALCAAGELLKTDYGAMGVLLVLTMWLLRDRPLWRLLAAAAVLAAMVRFFRSNQIEFFALASFVLIGAYNGTRGRQVKVMFYIFYPTHLLFLCGVRMLLLQD